ncbi:MAG: extracellular solute-binding protein [Clostridia bacterium]|nr:extracellular solute-binding protein [Clostridia bacterium]
MRKLTVVIGMILMLAVLFSGCGTEPSSASEEPMYVHRPAFAHLDGKNAVRFGNVMRTETGYRYAYGYLDMGTAYDSGMWIVTCGADGTIEEEIKLTELGQRYTERMWLGERGLYCYSLMDNEDQSDNFRGLARFSFDGKMEAVTDVTVLRQKGYTNDSPVNGPWFAERNSGVAFLWNTECILADDSLERMQVIELPGQGYAMYADEDILRFVYMDNGVTMLGVYAADGTVTETFVLPERFNPTNGYMDRFLGYDNGCLYAWDTEGVFKWRAEAENTVVTDVLDFVDSGIASDYIRALYRTPGEGDGEYAVYQAVSLQNVSSTLKLYRPDPTIDLSAIETLTLACIQPESSLTQAVVEFNESHMDVRIEVIDYGIYNTQDDPAAGYDRIMLDLTTGVLEPDLTFLTSFDHQELAEDGYFIDLYTLMDGTLTPDTIYGCVRNTLESADGKLYGLVPEFYLTGLVGRRDIIGDAKKWSLTEFLDFAEGLGDGEYLMEEISQKNAEYTLFNFLANVPFTRDGQANFLDAEYLRLLEFLMTLPKEPQLYMEHGSSNVQDLYAGLITEDQVEIVQGGENLYFNGSIKLYEPGAIQTVDKFMRLGDKFGVSSVSGINLIGSPVDDRCVSGVELNLYGGVYAIPVKCRNVDAAWEFIESRMTADDYRSYGENNINGQVDLSYFFKAYKPDYDEYLDTLEGYQMFILYGNMGRISGMDVAEKLDENGRYNGQPGTLCVLDEAAVDYIKEILDTAGVPLWYSAEARSDLRKIINEEWSRLFSGASTAESTADVIQSRVSIWLSEHE